MLTEPKLFAHFSQVPEEDWRWKDFSPREIACKGTGAILVNPSALDMLQELRDRIGHPLIVHSGYRSPEHNRRVGGAKHSKHMLGIAFDVSMANHDPAHYIAEAWAVGFKGVGTYPRQNFVHVDARTTDAVWGNPFPERQAAFSVEPPRLRESLAGSPEITGSSVAGVSTTGTVAVGQLREAAVAPVDGSLADSLLEVVTDAQTEVSTLLPLLDGLWWVFVLLTFAGIGLAIYGRVDDFQKRRR